MVFSAVMSKRSAYNSERQLREGIHVRQSSSGRPHPLAPILRDVWLSKEPASPPQHHSCPVLVLCLACCLAFIRCSRAPLTGRSDAFESEFIRVVREEKDTNDAAMVVVLPVVGSSWPSSCSLPPAVPKSTVRGSACELEHDSKLHIHPRCTP